MYSTSDLGTTENQFFNLFSSNVLSPIHLCEYVYVSLLHALGMLRSKVARASKSETHSLQNWEEAEELDENK